MSRPGFDLQGHRGARGLLPENSLEGFAAAQRLGISSFEIDIAVTRDGIPVLSHDPALHADLTRTPDGAWLHATGPLIKDLSFEQLEGYDVGQIRPGSDYSGRYPSQAGRDGIRIPTLAAVLAAYPHCRFNIELKLVPTEPDWTVSPDVMVACVLDVVDRTEASDRVTIQSFDWRAPRRVAAIRPDIARGWLTEAKTIAAAPLWQGQPSALTIIEAVPDAIAAEGGGTWTPFYADLTETLLAQAHALGLRVIPWTVNSLEDMRRLIEWGVDGLISDWPDRAIPLLD